MKTTVGRRDHGVQTDPPAAVQATAWGRPVVLGILLGFTVLATVMMAGCGNLTAGGIGETTVLVTADGNEGGEMVSEPQAASTRTADVADGPSPTVALLGSIEVTLQVFLRGPDGDWSELTADVQMMTLPLSGGQLEELLTERLGEGLYEEARVVFHSVEAEVTGGLELDGVPIIDRIRVAIVDPLPVDRDIGLWVQELGATEILIDLNAGEWLGAATESTLGLEVSADAFEAAVSVTSRSVL